MAPLTPVDSPVAARALSAPFAALRLLALTLLFTAAAVYEAVHLAASGGDIWWHLRTGLWILQNHTVPRTGIFSQQSDLRWIASSWGFEVLAAAAYKLLGLRAIPILLMGMKLALAVVTFLLGRGGRANFWTAILLSAIAQYVIGDLQPLPIVLSILFFGVELLLLLQSRRSGDVRLLFWLPPLFLLWANLHIQFVTGLLLLGLFLSALFTERLLGCAGVAWFQERQPSLPLATVGGVTGVSTLSTLVNPYSFHLFQNVLKNAYSDVSFHYFAEMRAMSFRRPQHYVTLLLVMAAFFALGRKRSRDLFKIGMMIAGALIAFRIQRDLWYVVLASIAVLADAFGEAQPAAEPPSGIHLWKWRKPLMAVLVVVVVTAAASRIPGRDALMNKLSETFPVNACDFIRKNQLPPPLFNAYEWGGFLTWYLPEYPVAIDGRVDLYGDEITEQHLKVTSGSQRLETDPNFSQARTILLQQRSAMAKALTTLPSLSSSYRVAYSDNVATVLVRQ